MIQVFHTEDHYILQDGDFTLWCSRTTGALEPKKGIDLCSAWNPVCIGMVYGVIGKVKVHPESEWSLLLIKQRAHVGRIDIHDIYKIHKIAVIPLSGNDPGELDLELCRMHHFGIKKASLAEPDSSTGKQIQKKLKSIKIAASENIKPKNKESKDKDKFIKRIMEELVKMFNESDSFYFSETFDLTNSIHKQYSSSYSPKKFLWERVDNRFFWNYHMTKEIREMYLENEDPELWSHWILPVIQGYVQIEHCIMDFKGDKGLSDSTHKPEFGNTKYTAPLEYDIGIISRRNRNRAGTRSKKRGLEDTGACANYVETEQFLEFKPHIVSFVQVRGSIPVYWSQSGYKYRPPPRLDKDDSSSSSSDESDDNDDGDDELLLHVCVALINRREIPRIRTYFDIVMHYDDQEFRRNFRLTRDTFNGIVDFLENTMRRRIYKGGREQISLERQVLITIWYFANTECYRSIASRFGVCESTVMKSVDDVVFAFLQDEKRFISWPKREQLGITEVGFRAFQGMPGVIGAVDGTHIPIIAPSQNHANYVNRKGFHSIVAQLICDHTMKFMSVNVGWPGSVHDARVFRTSRVGRRIINNTLLPAHCHLVGDAAYPLCTNLMTPFKDIGNLTRQQQRYNFCQSSTRMVIERSIGQLKGRFRKLKMLDCSRPKTGNFTKFCCCLHNLCISGGDLLQDDEMDMEEQVNNGPAPPQPAAVVVNATQKRQNIMQQL